MKEQVLKYMSDREWHLARDIIDEFSHLAKQAAAVRQYHNWHRARSRKGEDDIEVQVALGQRVEVIRFLWLLAKTGRAERCGGRSENAKFRLAKAI